MKLYSSVKPLISLHIPKCAGSSLREVLAEWFGAGFYLHYYDERANMPPPAHPLWDDSGRLKNAGPSCVHGHFNRRRGTGVEQYYPHADQFITILRDPFERQLSNYFYVLESARKQKPAQYFKGQLHPILEQQLTLEDWLLLPNNLMLNFLPEGINEGNCSEILEEKFLYIGVSERLDLVISDLANILGFEAIQVPLMNESPREDSLELEGLRERFGSVNPIETAIYQYARNRVI